MDSSVPPPAAPAKQQVFSVGQVVGEHYRVIGLLGRGGMGEVYEAIHELTGQGVAVKLLPAKLADDDQFRERFLGEARVLAKLDHPNIVPLLNFFIENGRYVLVMKRIRGDSVADLLIKSGRLSPEQALVVFEAICAALEYAHDIGVIHRDIKPANILLDFSGVPLLVDFGLARVTNTKGPTKSGYAVGTFNYMAPEQIRAEPTGPPADIYAMGATVFEMFSGGPPFRKCDSDYDLLKAHVERAPPQLADMAPVSAEVSVLVDCCLKKNPEERPTAAQARAAVALELQRLRSASQPVAPALIVERPTNDSVPLIEVETVTEKSVPLIGAQTVTDNSASLVNQPAVITTEEPVVLLDKPKPSPPEQQQHSGMRTALVLILITTLGLVALLYHTEYWPWPDLRLPGSDGEVRTQSESGPAAAADPRLEVAPAESGVGAPAEERASDPEVAGGTKPAVNDEAADDAGQLVRQATRLQRAGKTARAIELFERALDAEPSSSTEVDAWVGLGWCYSDLGETGDAIRLFERAVGSNPNMSEAHIGLAECHRQAGHAKKAILHSEKYLRILPSGPDAALARQILRELKTE